MSRAGGLNSDVPKREARFSVAGCGGCSYGHTGGAGDSGFIFGGPSERLGVIQ